MSFFGFEQNNLEKEKSRFAAGHGDSEDVAVYTWGEDGYDSLGDALQEGGDEFNDETFGGTEEVAKDFDFSSHALPDDKRVDNVVQERAREVPMNEMLRGMLKESADARAAKKPAMASPWEDQSSFPAASRSQPIHRPNQYESPTLHHAPGMTHTGIRTLKEIEAEMLAQASEQSRQEELHRQELIFRRQQEEEYLRRQEEEYLRRQEEELHRQRLHYQQEQQLQRLQQQQLMQQKQQQQQHHTPPPRMLPVTSQSPRFLERQRQILMLQQQQEQQQILRLQELQEQLRVEELERQLRAHPRQSAEALHELQAAQMLQEQQRRRQRSQSPATRIPQNMQILSDITQAEFIQSLNPVEQEALRAEAMRKIVETEKMEEKRRRKAAKIAHMSRFNDLMTQSDKDFITRIQVSQLVTQDPYADDFYAQVYGALMRSRMGVQAPDERVLKFGSGGGVGLGLAQKPGNRRPNAMQRMEQQVERIVSNARRREEEKGLHSVHSLQGALGKTSGRSYKAAPRQLLQVDASAVTSSPTLPHAKAHNEDSENARPGEDAAARAAKLGREALGEAHDPTELIRKDPLTRRQVLVALEELYDLVLEVEQLRRNQPHPDEPEALPEWEAEYSHVVDQIWDGMRVMVPLATSNPHPFISLLQVTKGKKILLRIVRHLNSQRMLTVLTLLIACFGQLDIVKYASVLDQPTESEEREELDRQTNGFLHSVLQSILPTLVKGNLRLITGLLGLFLSKNDILMVAQTRPGIVLLTMFMTRVEFIKTSDLNIADAPNPEEWGGWQEMYDHLFQSLAPVFPLLFPSTRMAQYLQPDQHISPDADVLDETTWQFLAAFALHASSTQHQILVGSLREKVLENVLSAKKGWMDEQQRKRKLTNVDLFLHAIGLDSSQIAM